MSATKMKADPKDIARRLVKAGGTTYAEQAGISVKDTPQPLFQLLMLASMMSKPISAEIAVAAAKELFAAGWRSPDSVLEAEWQDIVDAFGRAHYVRYDESTASRLHEMARVANEKYGGDLRRLAKESDRDVATAKRLLQEFKGIGDTGADIFLREVQDAWTWVRPYFDKRTLDSARKLGLPADPDELSSLAGKSCAPLAAALMRASKDKDVRKQVTD
jgi:endonuclease III